ncbi:oxygenase MpaB family protein [Iamia majanohamensis]|uniref:Oxygenase MpaB family protein n=1 Tax=Iamia majanohamensis TaxID=467976 RepID=A0AAE9YGJ7_9ACTN|nr:oxygenase MpaB family protein [Iamia majanohamensis]WCO68087.1 oxygenase MpaB family protein [Iamia majanohamensis]
MTGRRYRDVAVGAPIGPGSLLWATAGDPRSLLPGSAAGIMQLMLPGLGAGVTDHSAFFDDPFGRINRSIPVIWGSIFTADDDEGGTRGRAIRDLHPDIKGTDDQGRRYHALDPDVFWWAHATFTWELLRARQLYWPIPLRRGQQEQLYAETVTWYRRYGLSDRPVPPTLDAFRDRFEEVCRTELELTPAAQWVLDPRANPEAAPAPLRLPPALAPLRGVVDHLGGEALRLLVFGAMPDSVRRRFGFPWSPADRAGFVGLCGLLRTLEPAVRRGALDGLWPEGTPHLDGRGRRVTAPSRPARATAGAPTPA